MTEGVFAHWPNRITALRFLASLGLFTIFPFTAADAVRRGAGREVVELTEPASPALVQVCFWLFLLIALSDVLDGWLARRGGVVTAFGRVADPFVDKILVLGTMIYLASLAWSDRFFPAWIVVVVLARELLVTGVRGYVESVGRAFPADWLGKVKMLLQCTAVCMVLGMYGFRLDHVVFWQWVAHALVWGTMLTSVLSGLSYVAKSRRILLEGAG